MFRHLLARLESFEVSGPVERLSSAVNGSIKRLPARSDVDPRINEEINEQLIIEFCSR